METEQNDIDERWMSEWVEFGMREFESYLGKHRKFDDYYARRTRLRPAFSRS
ncbi:MAG: hypothetical protein QOJ13_3103 [Gaiellales bacterium]|jgi:hypothetical protein|nr:hypothetical protein [Gaiellales bacterium]MDX6593907.1 hypothetical protein [Gaiellales bacterium]